MSSSVRRTHEDHMKQKPFFRSIPSFLLYTTIGYAPIVTFYIAMAVLLAFAPAYLSPFSDTRAVINALVEVATALVILITIAGVLVLSFIAFKATCVLALRVATVWLAWIFLVISLDIILSLASPISVAFYHGTQVSPSEIADSLRYSTANLIYWQRCIAPWAIISPVIINALFRRFPSFFGATYR